MMTSIQLLFINCAIEIFLRWNSKLANEAKIKAKKESRFKKIIGKSGEGIIILNDKTIEYMNDKFIEQ